MALSATIFKADLSISDMDRNYYAEHQLTLARHPSENDERMMVRLLAFVLNADERLSFTKGLCDDEEPDLWLKSLTDQIDLWIDVGLPDERRVRKACNRSSQVYLYLYGGRTAEMWWKRNAEKIQRFNNLNVIEIPEATTAELIRIVQRNMHLQCTIQDGELYLTAGEKPITVSPLIRKQLYKF